MRGITDTYKCKCCGKDFVARVADRKRGWARFCSKSCKAIEQESHTHQLATYKDKKGMSDFWRELDEHDELMREMEWGWDGYKNTF